MDPETSPDPTFRASVETAISEDRPAVLISLLDLAPDGVDRMEIAVTDGVDPLDAADFLEHAATKLRAQR